VAEEGRGAAAEEGGAEAEEGDAEAEEGDAEAADTSREGMGSLMPLKSFHRPPPPALDATEHAGEFYRKYMLRGGSLPNMDKRHAQSARRCVEWFNATQRRITPRRVRSSGMGSLSKRGQIALPAASAAG
jgi:hypothetical protein